MSNKFVVDFDAFRFYEDDGSESASTPIENQDINVTNWNVSSDSQLHLRYRVQETGGGSIAGDAADDYTIQYRVNGAGGWTTVTASSARVQADTGSQLTDGAATTDRATNGISAGSGSFFAGVQEEGDGEITDFQHEADNHTEHVWALNLPSADWTGGDFVDFRAQLNGGNVDNAVTPRITSAVAAAYSEWQAAVARRMSFHHKIRL